LRMCLLMLLMWVLVFDRRTLWLVFWKFVCLSYEWSG
jgi:hypothetical protein